MIYNESFATEIHFEPDAPPLDLRYAYLDQTEDDGWCTISHQERPEV